MKKPKNIKHVRAFEGQVKYYMDMWARRSHLLQPSTALTSDKVTFQWTYVEQQAFDKIVQKVARDTFLRYPDFNELFDIHTDDSNFQLGTVIGHNGKQIAFFCCKLTPAQSHYAVTEK